MARAKTNNKLAVAEKTLATIAAKLDLAEAYLADGDSIRGVELLREAKTLAEGE